ncbi:MAG: hypothetical protein HZA78_02750 [Candidatus Schekmanbacteria bacterium]|nr:hypothetical protein [Candidatus Schekmanbacteria bacterium]
MRNLNLLLLIALFVVVPSAWAVEVAPRISDREIVERLTRLEEGQQALNASQQTLRSEMNLRFNELREDTNTRFAELRSDMNARFELITWMLGLFISIASITLGFVVRIQWQMNKRQTQMEKALETQKDEMTFLKGLVEKLLPTGRVL